MILSSKFLPFRSSHQSCSIKNGVPGNLAKLTGKNLCQSLFFNEVACLSPAILSKKRLLHRSFPVNFAKSQEHLFLQNTSSGCFCTSHVFFISSTFISNAMLKLTKNQANAKQHPEVELLLFENYSHYSSMLSSINNRRYSKK